MTKYNVNNLRPEARSTLVGSGLATKQGTPTQEEGSVHLTSTFRYFVL
jgi:hypothetical protein